MNKDKIYKYTLEITDRQILKIPESWFLLDIQNQNGKIVMWVRVSPDNELFDNAFYIIATGQDLHDKCDEHLGTIQIDKMVWHVYKSWKCN